MPLLTLGNLPDVMLLISMNKRLGAIISAEFLRIIGRISSNPVGLIKQMSVERMLCQWDFEFYIIWNFITHKVVQYFKIIIWKAQGVPQ